MKNITIEQFEKSIEKMKSARLLSKDFNITHIHDGWCVGCDGELYVGWNNRGEAMVGRLSDRTTHRFVIDDERGTPCIADVLKTYRMRALDIKI